MTTQPSASTAAPALTKAQSHAVLEAAESGRYPPTATSAELAAALRAAGHPAFAAPGAAPDFGLPPPRGAISTVAAPSATAGCVEDDGDPEGPPEHAIGAPAPETGLEGTGSADLLIPALRIKQGTTKAEAAAGVPLGHLFLDVDPSGAAPTRSIRVLDVRSERSFLFPMDEEKAETVRAACEQRGVHLPDDVVVVCASPDRVTPVDRGHGVLSAQCAACVFSMWRRTPRGKNVKPACAEGYLVLGLDEATGLPFRVRLSGSGIVPMKGLITQLQMRAATARAAKPPTLAPSWAFRVTMSSTKDTGPTGQPYYAARFSGLTRVSEDEEAAGLALRRAILAMPPRHFDETDAADAAEVGA